MFAEVDLLQGSVEWLKWRQSGVGSSDISCLTGNDEYKTLWTLWAQKKGIVRESDLSANPNVQRGKCYESSVRKVIEKKLGKPIRVICGENTEKPWRKVSFDGVFDDEGSIPVEIKCPAENLFIGVLKYGRNSVLYRTYEDQLMYQMGMLEAPYGLLVFYCVELNQFKIFKVTARTGRITQIMEVVDRFNRVNLVGNKPPAKDPERDIYELSVEELEQNKETCEQFLKVSQKARKAHKEFQELKAERDKLSSKILGISQSYRSVSVHGIVVSTTKQSEKFDWEGFTKSKHILPTKEETQEYTILSQSNPRLKADRDRIDFKELPSSLKIIGQLARDLRDDLVDSNN